MAKEDFCFTYYDGDAARDTTHMNRLERGCYHDIIISQRKFGHLSLDQIKKILGKDFSECWPSIELILKVDDDGRFHVEWLTNSISKARKHSKKQKDNVTKRYQETTNSLPKIDLVEPLGDGNGDGDELVVELIEGVQGEKVHMMQVSLPSKELEVDDTLEEVTYWTDQVIAENDVVFIEQARKHLIPINEAVKKLARDHLALCSRYNWHKHMESQQAFRNSLLKHVTENINKNEQQSTKGISRTGSATQVTGTNYSGGLKKTNG